jgi:hypothetical protein
MKYKGIWTSDPSHQVQVRSKNILPWFGSLGHKLSKGHKSPYSVNLMKISSVYRQMDGRTDRQTDRQTDKLQKIAYSWNYAKNAKISFHNFYNQNIIELFKGKLNNLWLRINKLIVKKLKHAEHNIMANYGKGKHLSNKESFFMLFIYYSVCWKMFYFTVKRQFYILLNYSVIFPLGMEMYLLNDGYKVYYQSI